MKAPVRAARRIQSQMKRRTQAHSAFIYRAHKEVSLAGMRTPDLLVRQLRIPRPVLLRLVSSEASRLSRTNRVKTVTVREINAAVRHVHQRTKTTAAA